jgi:hypothetical protein
MQNRLRFQYQLVPMNFNPNFAGKGLTGFPL